MVKNIIEVLVSNLLNYIYDLENSENSQLLTSKRDNFFTFDFIVAGTVKRCSSFNQLDLLYRILFFTDLIS